MHQLEDVEASLAILVLRDERLRSPNAVSYVLLCESGSLAGLDEQRHEVSVRVTMDGFPHALVAALAERPERSLVQSNIPKLDILLVL